MFKELGQLAGVMKQLQGLSGRMETVQTELVQHRCLGRSSNGAVEVEMNGQGVTLRCGIAPQLLGNDDRVQLQASVVEAVNAAQEQVRTVGADALKRATGGLDLGGLSNLLDAR